MSIREAIASVTHVSMETGIAPCLDYKSTLRAGHRPRRSPLGDFRISRPYLLVDTEWWHSSGARRIPFWAQCESEASSIDMYSKSYAPYRLGPNDPVLVTYDKLPVS